jgi:exodeoxyribonuclease-5
MIELTEEQKRGIQKFADWFRKGEAEGFSSLRFVISGPAGSGKSTLAEYALAEIGIDPASTSVAKVAYTGKAAMVMKQKGLADATTIHSAIYIPVEDVDQALSALKTELLQMRAEHIQEKDPENKAILKGAVLELEDEIKTIMNGQKKDEVYFIIDPKSILRECRLVLCDEASMVGGRIQIDLESFGVPILYLGDNFQLPPIDLRGGSVFFHENGEIVEPDFALTQIHRQAEGSAIIRYSRAIRENDPSQFFTGRDNSDDGGALMRIPMDRIMAEHMVRAKQVICGKNKTRHALNKAIREEMQRASHWPGEGDKLICLRNSKEAALVNGMTANAIRGMYDFDGRNNCFKIDIETEGGKKKIGIRVMTTYFSDPGDEEALKLVPWWMQKELAHFDYGYCITAHKSQGSQYTNGIVIEQPLGRSDIMRRRWKYTAVTRFSKSAVIGF